MALKKTLFLFFLILTIFTLSGSSYHRKTIRNSRKVSSNTFLHVGLDDFYNITRTTITLPDLFAASGEWVWLHHSIGVSAMHMQLLNNNKVVIFDRTDFGPSNLSLPDGAKCRYNDDVIPADCTAHSILYDVFTNTFRPLMVQTDVWCSSGSVNPNGTLVQTGGYHGGDRKIRLFSPCSDDTCDWNELPQNLTVRRWYASNQILHDGRVIIVGGRRAFSYEFFPQRNTSNPEVYPFPFLMETEDPLEENNLYPFLHLLPDGNLFVFANNRSILFDYLNNKVLKEFPMIPGEKRSYPATGSSVLLPIWLNNGERMESPEVEVMICGGAHGGAYMAALNNTYVGASNTCGRLKVTDPEPHWMMEEMPMGRVMSDTLLLPTGDVLIINGASKGSAGWDNAENPVLNPVLYRPKEEDPTWRFVVLKPTTVPRLYHSSAIVLPDGRVLVGGSNPNVHYNFTGVKYPTDLSLETFKPPYLAPQFAHLRPSVLALEGSTDSTISYGQEFSITFSVDFFVPDRGFMVTMLAPSFTTHSFAMNQRLLMLQIVSIEQLSVMAYKVTLHAPSTPYVAPPGYYMLFLVYRSVPSHGVWVKIISPSY